MTPRGTVRGRWAARRSHAKSPPHEAQLPQGTHVPTPPTCVPGSRSSSRQPAARQLPVAAPDGPRIHSPGSLVGCPSYPARRLTRRSRRHAIATAHQDSTTSALNHSFAHTHTYVAGSSNVGQQTLYSPMMTADSPAGGTFAPEKPAGPQQGPSSQHSQATSAKARRALSSSSVNTMSLHHTVSSITSPEAFAVEHNSAYGTTP